MCFLLHEVSLFHCTNSLQKTDSGTPRDMAVLKARKNISVLTNNQNKAVVVVKSYVAFVWSVIPQQHVLIVLLKKDLFKKKVLNMLRNAFSKKKLALWQWKES